LLNRIQLFFKENKDIF